MDEKRDEVMSVEQAHDEECVVDEAPEPEDEVFEKHAQIMGRESGNEVQVTSRLPTFEIGQHVKAFAARLKREAQRKEEERLREEKKRREYREERERKTAMFVTPGLPPLAMAPDFDPEYLERILCSDIQARRLFPNDPARQCAIKDVQGECYALVEYHHWLCEQKTETDGKSSGELARCGFYQELFNEVKADYQEVWNEFGTLLSSATVLGQFEFHSLDKDGRTTALEAKLSKGDVIWQEHDPAVQAAYKELWIKYPYLERFERRWELDKGIEYFEERLKRWGGEIFFDEQPEVVKRKYGYLLDRLKAEGYKWGVPGHLTESEDEHESHEPGEPSPPGSTVRLPSSRESSRDEQEGTTANKGTEGTARTAKRRLTI